MHLMEQVAHISCKVRRRFRIKALNCVHCQPVSVKRTMSGMNEVAF
jgi:hypothetical protein